MTYEEFRKRDLELFDQISDYNIDNSRCEEQIAHNNKQIAILDKERCHLRDEYYKGKGEQRGLCGNVIKK